MSNQQNFLDFVKAQLHGVKAKPGKIERHDFMKTLKYVEEQLCKQDEDAKKGSSSEIQLKKTTRDAELKQQKQIVQLQQKLQQVQKDSQEFKEQNHQLYGEVKKQKQIIKQLERDKQQYEREKVIWDKKLQIQEQLYGENLKMTDDVKKVLNIINDDIDREALRRAKRGK